MSAHFSLTSFLRTPVLRPTDVKKKGRKNLKKNAFSLVLNCQILRTYPEHSFIPRIQMCAGFPLNGSVNFREVPIGTKIFDNVLYTVGERSVRAGMI